ncbi:MAG: hypothetical protein WD341_06055 [Tistlia sp.]|uniref:hypothetical protein n=1 Tax=Tistlia sp. TaxID=3057121 RepID=UPI0034A4925C
MTPERPLRGEAIELDDAGWSLVTVHPRWLVSAEIQTFLQLWQDCDGPAEGAGRLPFAGGAAEQPVLAMEAFAVLAGQLARVRSAERKAAEAEAKAARGRS